MNFLQVMLTWISENPGKTVGAIIGFIVGILIFTIGFVKTLLVGLLVLIGFIIGKARDEGSSVIEQINKLFRR